MGGWVDCGPWGPRWVPVTIYRVHYESNKYRIIEFHVLCWLWQHDIRPKQTSSIVNKTHEFLTLIHFPKHSGLSDFRGIGFCSFLYEILRAEPWQVQIIQQNKYHSVQIFLSKLCYCILMKFVNHSENCMAYRRGNKNYA